MMSSSPDLEKVRLFTQTDNPRSGSSYTVIILKPMKCSISGITELPHQSTLCSPPLGNTSDWVIGGPLRFGTPIRQLHNIRESRSSISYIVVYLKYILNLYFTYFTIYYLYILPPLYLLT
jgi:hypothetical protein